MLLRRNVNEKMRSRSDDGNEVFNRARKQIKAQESVTTNHGLNLLDLPQDILDAIVEKIGVGHMADRNSVRDMAIMARTCKKLQTYIGPNLYQKIYTKNRNNA